MLIPRVESEFSYLAFMFMQLSFCLLTSK